MPTISHSNPLRIITRLVKILSYFSFIKVNLGELLNIFCVVECGVDLRFGFMSTIGSGMVCSKIKLSISLSQKVSNTTTLGGRAW